MAYLEWNSQEWEFLATSPPPGDSAIDSATLAGIAAYANKKADVQRRMVSIFVSDWYRLLEQLPLDLPLLKGSLDLSWLKKYTPPPAAKRNHLVSNAHLYHSDLNVPQTDPLDAGEVVSDMSDGPNSAIIYSHPEILDL